MTRSIVNCKRRPEGAAPPAKLMFLDCSIVFRSLTGISDSTCLLCLAACGCESLCDSTTCR